MFSRNFNRARNWKSHISEDWKLLTILQAEQDIQTDKNSLIQTFKKIRRRNRDSDSKHHAGITKIFIVVLLYCFKNLRSTNIGMPISCVLGYIVQKYHDSIFY